MNWSKVQFAVEVGAEADIDAKIFVCGRDLFLIKDYETVEKITAKKFKEIVGIGIREIKKRFRDDDYFIMMPKTSEFWDDSFEELTDEDGIGIYLETDHQQLVEDGIYAKEMVVVNND